MSTSSFAARISLRPVIRSFGSAQICAEICQDTTIAIIVYGVSQRSDSVIIATSSSSRCSKMTYMVGDLVHAFAFLHGATESDAEDDRLVLERVERWNQVAQVQTDRRVEQEPGHEAHAQASLCALSCSTERSVGG